MPTCADHHHHHQQHHCDHDHHQVFTEEYQAELMGENFKAFDTVRAEGWFIGTVCRIDFSFW